LKKPEYQLLRTPALVAIVALAIRLIVLAVLHAKGTVPSSEYVNETTQIAASLASGKGFSSPFALAPSGPTAWLCPIFPFIVSIIFRVFGIFSAKSLLTIQIVNCSISALAVFPIYFAAKRSFGTAAAILAQWLWVFLPFAWWTPVQDIWDSALTALLVAVVLWATLAVRDKNATGVWIAYGALWGVSALVNPAILSLLFFFMAWLLYQRPTPPGIYKLVAAAVAVCILMLAPWTIRNHTELGRWIPLRSNFGMELWLGNNSSGEDVNTFASHPLWNADQARSLRQMGEVNYVQAKQRAALDYMQSHPAATVHAILGRIASNWFAVTDRPHANWATSPMYVRLLFAMNLAMILLSAAGIVFAIRDVPGVAMLYVIAVLVFPLPYYLTHTLVRYRFPIEPVLTILCVYGLLRLVLRKPLLEAACGE
jgi:4-amino-4-deoxy-L-arabinose transferase-like glycosyltransferase